MVPYNVPCHNTSQPDDHTLCRIECKCRPYNTNPPITYLRNTNLNLTSAEQDVARPRAGRPASPRGLGTSTRSQTKEDTEVVNRLENAFESLELCVFRKCGNLRVPVCFQNYSMSGDDEHSRQILSYWTHERMQSAEPEPGIEFSTMSSADSAKAILDYWTPARVAAAVPEEHAYDEHTGEDFDKDVQLQGAGSMKIVPDTTVKTFPYQSVGKLFYTKVGPSGSRDSYASAWVANMTTLLHVVYTAAHNLKRGNEHAENISFFPGFIPPSTRPFGSYPQIPGGEGVAWAVDPHWNPNNLQPQYDQGIVKLAADANTRKHVDEVVIPIQISSNQQYTSFSKWNSIGFPEPTRMNPAGKIMERSGTFNKVSNNTVLKYGTLPKGTSGGAWILANSNDSANGVQAGNRNDVGCAVSPYFHSSTEELVKFFKFMS